MKKILVLSPFYHYPGHFKEIADAFNGYKDKKINYHLAVIGSKKTFNNKISIPVPASQLASHGYLKKYIFFSTYIEQFVKIFINFIFLIKCKKFFDNYDYIYFYDYEYLSTAIFINFLKKKRLKYSICIHSSNTLKNFFYKIYKKLFFYYLKKNFDKLDLIFVNDIKTKKDLINFGFSKIKIHAIQFFIDDSKYSRVKKNYAIKKLKIKLNPNKKIAIIFGLLRKDKNIFFSLNLIKSLKNFHLILAGKNGDLTGKEIKKYISFNKINNVTFINKYLNFSDINLVYSLADIYFFNYDINFNSQSGPVSLCRQFQVPVIAYKKTTIGNYISKHNIGITANKFTVTDFKKNIEALFKSKKKISLLKKNNKYLKNKFSSKEAFKKYSNLFLNC